MRTLLKIFCVVLALSGLAGGLGRAQELPMVETPPAHGTFWLTVGRVPYPFDPYYGALDIFEVGGGVYLIDDTPLFDSIILEGGGMSLMSGSPSPPGVAGTNSGGTSNICCSGPTNFTVAYLSGTNEPWLEISVVTNNVATLWIHTSDTNTPYDVFGSTNLNSLALPALSRTNWQLLRHVTGTTTNFNWANITPCEAWFQLGKTNDYDGDGLTDAYENLVSHTKPLVWDTDGDGLSDGWEWWNGLNPWINESAQSGSRLNYSYDGAGRLRLINGVRSKTITSDPEGNVVQITP